MLYLLRFLPRHMRSYTTIYEAKAAKIPFRSYCSGVLPEFKSEVA